AVEIAASDLLELGRAPEALAYLDEASEIKAKSGIPPRTSRFNFNTGVRIRLALAQGQVESARSMLGELFVDPKETRGLSFTAMDQALLTADVDLADGHTDAAAEIAAQVRQKIEKSGLQAYFEFYTMRADLIEGEAALQDNRPQAALPLLQSSLKMREKLLDPSSPKIAEAQIALARCHLAMGDLKQAQTLATSATAIHSLHKELGEQYREPLRQLQAQLKSHAGS
ncbi:MAG: tetratricopeptide repeat protein, partial [Dokdonella sp.]